MPKVKTLFSAMLDGSIDEYEILKTVKLSSGSVYLVNLKGTQTDVVFSVSVGEVDNGGGQEYFTTKEKSAAAMLTDVSDHIVQLEKIRDKLTPKKSKS